MLIYWLLYHNWLHFYIINLLAIIYSTVVCSCKMWKKCLSNFDNLVQIYVLFLVSTLTLSQTEGEVACLKSIANWYSVYGRQHQQVLFKVYLQNYWFSVNASYIYCDAYLVIFKKSDWYIVIGWWQTYTIYWYKFHSDQWAGWMEWCIVQRTLGSLGPFFYSNLTTLI